MLQFLWLHWVCMAQFAIWSCELSEQSVALQTHAYHLVAMMYLVLNGVWFSSETPTCVFPGSLLNFGSSFTGCHLPSAALTPPTGQCWYWALCQVHRGAESYRGQGGGVNNVGEESPDSISDRSEKLTPGDQILEVRTDTGTCMYVHMYMHVEPSWSNHSYEWFKESSYAWKCVTDFAADSASSFWEQNWTIPFLLFPFSLYMLSFSPASPSLFFLSSDGSCFLHCPTIQSLRHETRASQTGLCQVAYTCSVVTLTLCNGAVNLC